MIDFYTKEIWVIVTDDETQILTGATNKDLNDIDKITRRLVYFRTEKEANKCIRDQYRYNNINLKAKKAQLKVEFL